MNAKHKGVPVDGPMDVLVDGLVLGPSRAIEASEERGKQALLVSDVLPVEIQGRWLEGPRRLQTDAEARAEFGALGFTLGVSEGDVLFAPVTLPDGWARDGSGGHAMWSYLVDENGEQRVAIFYKAAYYDRRAFMRLIEPPAERSEGEARESTANKDARPSGGSAGSGEAA